MAPTTKAQHKSRSATWISGSLLFGYDFFISFTLGPPPRGTQSYASDLTRQLQDRDYTVFFSENEAPPGAELDATLKRALQRARVLVVVANTAALTESRWIREEVEYFRARHPARPIVPINVGSALEQLGAETEPWLGYERKIWLNESSVAVAEGSVTPETLRRLCITPRSMKAKTRLRSMVAAVMLVMLSLTGLWFRANRIQKQQRQVAVSRRMAALSESLAPSDWGRSILLGVAGTEDSDSS